MIKNTINVAVGAGPQMRGYSISASGTSDLTTAGATQAITLDTLYQGSVVLYVRIKHSTAFSGGGLTALTVSVGKSGGSATFFAPAFNIFQAVADGTLQENVATNGMGQLSAVTIQANFTATGANLSAITAGTVQIDI